MLCGLIHGSVRKLGQATFCCFRHKLFVEWSFGLNKSDFNTMEVNVELKVLTNHPVAPSTISPNFYNFNADFLN